MPKIISLSRKGFDAQYGGAPSPIIDNKLYSLPIPADETKKFNRKHTKKFKDLKFGNLSGSEILEKLNKTPLHSQKLPGKKRNQITSESYCHHDPDLKTGIYGAAGTASNLLKGFKEGDLLLFYGWFFDKNGEKRNIHNLFGWLQVDYIIKGSKNIQNFCDKNNITHPHADESFLEDETNALYVSSGDEGDEESLGYGIFENYHRELCLTHPLSKKRTTWQLNQNYFSEIKAPWEIFKKFIKEEHFKYNPDSKTNDPLIRDELTFKSPDKGQEIFMDGDHPKVNGWARYLIKTYGKQGKQHNYII